MEFLSELRSKLYPLIKIENLLVRRVLLLVHIPVILVRFVYLHGVIFIKNLGVEARGFTIAWTHRVEPVPRHLAEDALHAVGLDIPKEK